MQDYTKLRNLWESVEKQIDSYGKKPLNEGKLPAHLEKYKKEKKAQKEDTGAEAVNGEGNEKAVPTKLGKKAKKEASSCHGDKKKTAKKEALKGAKGNKGLNKKLKEDHWDTKLVQDIQGDLEVVETEDGMFAVVDTLNDVEYPKKFASEKEAAEYFEREYGVEIFDQYGIADVDDGSDEFADEAPSYYQRSSSFGEAEGDEEELDDVEGDEEELDDVDADMDAGVSAEEDIVSRIQAAYPGLEVMITVKGEIPPEILNAAGEVEGDEEDELGSEEDIEDIEAEEPEMEEGLNLERFLEDDEEDGEVEDDGDEEGLDDLDGEVEDNGTEVSLPIEKWEEILNGGGEVEGDDLDSDGEGEEIVPIEPEGDEVEGDEQEFALEAFRLAKKAGSLKKFKEAMKHAHRYLR